MNMNLDLVNRAIIAVGQSPLTEEDIALKNTAYNLCKSFYLSTFLEALSEVEWVRGRKREKLVMTGRTVMRNDNYLYAYDTPYDCARPIELQDNEYFIVEDKLILTDDPKAELLYVSNGRTLPPIASVVMRLGEIPENEYLTAGPPGTIPEITLYSGGPSDIKETPPEDPEPLHDYPDYNAVDYEPKFFEYIEKKLAAKLAIKLTDQPRLHTQLLQEALLVKQEAVDTSRASKAAKVKENKWWSDELGIGG